MFNNVSFLEKTEDIIDRVERERWCGKGVKVGRTEFK